MVSFVSLTLSSQINRTLQLSIRYIANLGGRVNLISYLLLRSRGVVPKVAVASKTAPKAVLKAAFATESSGIESGAHLSGQRPRIQSGLCEPVADWEKRQAKSDEEWLQQQRIQRETPTAATLEAIDAATTTAIDATIDATERRRQNERTKRGGNHQSHTRDIRH
jgi:hypothetical protein